MCQFSWSLSGSWLTGVLTALYAVVNRFSIFVCFLFWGLFVSSSFGVNADSRFDVTRVTFTVPLREHFSLPFIFSQVILHFQLSYFPRCQHLQLLYSSRYKHLQLLLVHFIFLITSVCSLAAWVTILPTENPPTRLFNLLSFFSPGISPISHQVCHSIPTNLHLT